MKHMEERMYIIIEVMSKFVLFFFAITEIKL